MRALYVVFSTIFQGKLDLSHGYQFMGLVGDWLLQAGLDDLAHTREGLHPVSLGPLRFLDGRDQQRLHRQEEDGVPFFSCVPGELLAGRISFLRDASAARFIEYLEHVQGELIRVGRSSFRLEKPRFTGYAPGMAPPGYVSSQEMVARYRKKESTLLGFRFYTPTGFKRQGAQYILPLPSLVFGSLLRRWRSWIDEKAWEFCQGREEETFEKIILSGVNIESRPMRLKNKSVYRGFVGTVHYDIHRCDAEERQMLHTLGAFAMYGGVGYKTTQGMGETELYKN